LGYSNSRETLGFKGFKDWNLGGKTSKVGWEFTSGGRLKGKRVTNCWTTLAQKSRNLCGRNFGREGHNAGHTISCWWEKRYGLQL